LTSSLGLVDSALDLNGLECKPSPSAKSTHIADPSSVAIGPMSQSMTTCETSLESNATLFAEASPAKTFHWREIEQDLRERALGYGSSTAGLLARYDRATRLWKTSQACFLSGFQTFSETWPRSGMTRNGIAYQLPPLVPIITGIESGLLPTLRTSKQKRAWKAYKRREYHRNLEEFLGECGFSGWISQRFCEWMMGFPLGWTGTKPLEMPLYRKLQKSSGGQL
jgi:hypothetical protein